MLSTEEIKLLNEMKDNCIDQANYIDPKAMEKYNLLRHIEGILDSKSGLRERDYKIITALLDKLHLESMILSIDEIENNTSRYVIDNYVSNEVKIYKLHDKEQEDKNGIMD